MCSMKKNILLLLIVGHLPLHASMHQSALTKKTTRTVGEFIAQHKAAIGIFATASLTAYHYREPITDFIKNIIGTNNQDNQDTKTVKNPSARLNSSENVLDADAHIQTALVEATSNALALADFVKNQPCASPADSQSLLVPPILIPEQSALGDEKREMKREKLELERMHSYPSHDEMSAQLSAAAQVDEEVEEVKAILDNIIETASTLLAQAASSHVLQEHHEDLSQGTIASIEELLKGSQPIIAAHGQNDDEIQNTPPSPVNMALQTMLMLPAGAADGNESSASGYHTADENLN